MSLQRYHRTHPQALPRAGARRLSSRGAPPIQPQERLIVERVECLILPRLAYHEVSDVRVVLVDRRLGKLEDPTPV